MRVKPGSGSELEYQLAEAVGVGFCRGGLGVGRRALVEELLAGGPGFELPSEADFGAEGCGQSGPVGDVPRTQGQPVVSQLFGQVVGQGDAVFAVLAQDGLEGVVVGRGQQSGVAGFGPGLG